MSKELKALERIRHFMSVNAVHWKQDIAMIETALKDYEELKKLKLLPYPKVNDEEYRRSVIKRLQAFEIINDCDIDIWLLKHCDYENYCRIRRLCLEATGNADKCVDCDKEIIDLPTEDEFDFLKEVLL